MTNPDKLDFPQNKCPEGSFVEIMDISDKYHSKISNLCEMNLRINWDEIPIYLTLTINRKIFEIRLRV